MKRLLLSSILLFICATLGFAQAPNYINYQGVARDAGGNVLANENISVRLTIHQGTPTGAEAYKELHLTVTNGFGLFNVQIGNGIILSGTIGGIDWSNGPYYLQNEMDPAGGSAFADMGTQQLISVPYALYAEMAGNGEVGPVGPAGPQGVQGDPGPQGPAGVSGASFALPWAGDFTGDGVGFQINAFGVQPDVAMKLVSQAQGGEALQISSSSSAGRAMSITQGADQDGLYIAMNGNENALELRRLNGTPSAYPMLLVYPNGGNAAEFHGRVDVIGNMDVTGSLSKGGGSFKIDHPLDPEDKYLYHSFVESLDMMNIYNGNVVTNGAGIAVVELPNWFEALNKDYRYQLTCIGTFANAIIKEKVRNNQFVIQTDLPNVEVSWTVTGIRQDAWANKNRIQTEVEKSEEEKGLYLHPEAFGLDKSKGIHQE